MRRKDNKPEGDAARAAEDRSDRFLQEHAARMRKVDETIAEVKRAASKQRGAI